MMRDETIEKLTGPLLAWFSENARALPWRQEPTPYRVWVSEIMLQQTRVEAVKPYFERFIRELPTVRALAECPQEKLLKLWEGLGYYNRVRNMQAAAQTVMEKYGGSLPPDYEALLSLRGIGSYTAGAIASIAFGIAVPAVDGNVLRVIARVTADERDISSQTVKREIARRLQDAMPAKKAGVYNQALMELGAIVCVPNGQPLCDLCPWSAFCLARAQGKTDKIPVKGMSRPRRIEEKTVLVIRDGDRFALKKRPDTGLLAGMYEFPNLEGFVPGDQVLRAVERMNLTPLRIEKIPDAKHIFSHVEWHMRGYAVRVAAPEGEGRMGEDELLFADLEDTKERYPIPAAFSAYVSLLLGSGKAREEWGEKNG